MADVLDLTPSPAPPSTPVVGFDERALQLIAETRTPLPAQPGRPHRDDREYQRNGAGNVCTTVEPRAGWRHVEVTQRRTATDFAKHVRWLMDVAYPDAEVIPVALDNLNTHSPRLAVRRLARC
jgi:hypothetical protein